MSLKRLFFHSNPLFSVPVRAAVQSAGQGPSPEMVPRLHAEREEKDPARARLGHPGSPLKDVQRSRVQRDQDSL